ncbi:hypothetical protein [Amycolatopsis suaedae]|uniref:Secreted protein n=1 Tax=Amycolatopsis suaedae TaxID=2510978 RepID=A0A4Q7J147_9PSEU|nr:hypothetical protein [Amycolatopsis suaedae]RZQ60547.1 hypothetical protein EWH70_28135 [Amycolatopsis suaedae]
MLTTKRIAAAAATVLAAAGLSLAAAAPAQATAGQCVKFLRNQGYVIGKGVVGACDGAAGGGAGGQTGCIVKLVSLGVTGDHAKTACKIATL